MKTDIILFGLWVVLGLSLGACSEDKGNYSYTEINEVTIERIASAYTCEAGGRLFIQPDVKSLDEAAADLSYLWTINANKVSEDEILDITLPPLGYGRQLAALTVFDNVTKMQYRKTFFVDVVNPFNWGYYFLTRKEDASTEIAYIHAVKQEGPTLEDVKYATGCGDYKFGTEPLQLNGSFGSMLDGYYWTIFVLTNGGDYPAIVTNNATFTANSLITEQVFSDPTAGYSFKPECSISTRFHGQYFVSEGKLIKYIMDGDTKKGRLYRPARHDKEYYWSNPVFAGNGAIACWVFDDLSRKYYVIEPYWSSEPAAGIFADMNALDKVVEIADNREIEGEIIHAAGTDYKNDLQVYSVATDGIHIYTFSQVEGTYRFLSERVLSVNGLSEKPAFAVGVGIAGNHWYTNGDAVIYYSPILSPQLDTWKVLPADLGLGRIEFIGFSARGNRMVVVLYDENSEEERKGSVIFIDVETKEITHKFPHILHHCVDYVAGNAYSADYSFTGGAGDEL